MKLEQVILKKIEDEIENGSTLEEMGFVPVVTVYDDDEPFCRLHRHTTLNIEIDEYFQSGEIQINGADLQDWKDAFLSCEGGENMRFE